MYNVAQMPQSVTPPLIDRDSQVPLYRQVQAWLRQEIESGAYPPGSKLPSVKTICAQFGGINHRTVRQAIDLLAKEGVLNAVPGRGAAVTSKTEKTLKIALVLPNIDDEITRQIAGGVLAVFEQKLIPVEGAEAIRRERVNVVILDSRHSTQKEIENIAHLQDMPLDGAIIYPVIYSDIVRHLASLESEDFPVVLFDCTVPGLSIPSIDSDNYGGGYLITKHLLERGRKKLAWIGMPRGISSAFQRFEGFRDALADFGLPLNRKLVRNIAMTFPTDPVEPFVRQLTDELVSNPEERPDAIVCCNDMIALGCLETLRERGVKVPEDVAVVGFDDLQETRSSLPPLTTVRQPASTLGAAAARLILARIFNKKFECVLKPFPVELVIRQSS